MYYKHLQENHLVTEKCETVNRGAHVFNRQIQVFLLDLFLCSIVQLLCSAESCLFYFISGSLPCLLLAASQKWHNLFLSGVIFYKDHTIFCFALVVV